MAKSIGIQAVILLCIVVSGCASKTDSSLAPSVAPNAIDKRSADSFVELQTLMANEYSHAGRRVNDWPKQLERYRQKIEMAQNVESFAVAAADALAEAADLHLTLALPNGQLIPTYTQAVAPNFDKKRLARNIQNIQSDKQCTAWGTLAGVSEVAYLAIVAWTEPCFQAASTRLQQLRKQSDKLILDVRINTGGDDRLAEQIANLFAAAPAVYEKTETKTPSGWEGPFSRLLTPRAEGPLFQAKNIAVLQGPAAMSSNESFLLMMRAAGATLVGETSRGSSGNPKPHKLANGLVVNVPSWRVFLPTGEPIEGVGIKPDIIVGWNTEMEDPVIQAASKHLSR